MKRSTILSLRPLYVSISAVHLCARGVSPQGVHVRAVSDAQVLLADARADVDNMPKRVYCDVYTRMCKALLDEDEEWDPVEVRTRLT